MFNRIVVNKISLTKVSFVDRIRLILILVIKEVFQCVIETKTFVWRYDESNDKQ
jgi:hypothetical protein